MHTQAGNDFLPFMPSIDIYGRPSGLDTIIDAYKVRRASALGFVVTTCWARWTRARCALGPCAWASESAVAVRVHATCAEL